MLLHYAGKGGRVLVSGAVHKAAVQAAELLDIELYYLDERKRDLRTADSPDGVGFKARTASWKRMKFSAFLCTSPDYYGQRAPLSAGDYARI